MNVLVVRHGIAEDKRAFARTNRADSLRPLTKQGIREMKVNVEGLKSVLNKIDVICTSPFVRARQTADILQNAFRRAALVENERLIPKQPFLEVIAWLRKQPAAGTVALVGHEPDLGLLVGAMTAGTPHNFAPLEKGGACLIAFKRLPEPGRGELIWSLPPFLLRQLS